MRPNMTRRITPTATVMGFLMEASTSFIMANHNKLGFSYQVSVFRTDGGFSVQVSASMFLFPDT